MCERSEQPLVRLDYTSRGQKLEVVPQKLTGRSLDSPVKKQPGKNILSGHTFLVTISPKGDISPQSEQALIKWSGKNSDYCYIVAERGRSGQRHIHMALAFNEARNKQCLQEDTWKYRVKKWHGDSIGKYAVVVTNMYNHDWYDEYLRKEEGVEVLLDEYDRDAITSLFPTVEQQQLFMELKGKRVVDSVLHEHNVLWSETDLPVSVGGALRYFRERMFQKKDMMVILDDRRVRQLALALYRYRTSNCDQTMEDDEWLNRCDPVRGSLYVHAQHSAVPP